MHLSSQPVLCDMHASGRRTFSISNHTLTIAKADVLLSPTEKQRPLLSTFQQDAKMMVLAPAPSYPQSPGTRLGLQYFYYAF